MGYNLNTNTIGARRRVGPPSIIYDGNTVAWYDYRKLITKDESDLVSSWADVLNSGNDIIQLTPLKKPVWIQGVGVRFDGINQFLEGVFSLVQPTMIYIVFKQKTWTINDRIFDGNTLNSGGLIQAPSSPTLRITAGAEVADNSNLPVDTFGIARVIFNEASSSLQIDETTVTTGNAGGNDMNGFILGARTGGGSPSNIDVKEVILRKIIDTSVDSDLIYNYLKKKII
jgi:hypothetical protein